MLGSEEENKPNPISVKEERQLRSGWKLVKWKFLKNRIQRQ